MSSQARQFAMPVARLGRRMLAQYEPFLHGSWSYLKPILNFSSLDISWL
jgi:hypothetical protein